MKIDALLSRKLSLFSFICALLVLIKHVPLYGPCNTMPETFVKIMILQQLTRIAVPFFFVSAGYFVMRGAVSDGVSYSVAISKRVKTLVIPFFCWAILQALLITPLRIATNIFHNVAWYNQLPWVLPLEMFGINLLKTPYYQPLWFLRDLFAWVLLSRFLAHIILKGRVQAFVLVGICLLLGIILPPMAHNAGFRNMFTLVWSPFGLASFSMGMALSVYPVNVNRVYAKMFLVCGILCAALNSLLYMRLPSTEGSYVYSALTIIAVVLILVGLFPIIPACELHTRFKNMAFPIYLTHQIVLSYLVLPVQQVFPPLYKSLIALPLFAVIGFVLTMLFVRITTFIPIVKFLYGGRLIK